MSIGIAGGGISGLSFALKASRISSKPIRIYEKDAKLGGWIQTVRTDSGKGSIWSTLSPWYYEKYDSSYNMTHMIWLEWKRSSRTSKVLFSNADQDQLDLPSRKKLDLVSHFWMNLDSKKILLLETKLILRRNIGFYGNGSPKDRTILSVDRTISSVDEGQV